ncbi:hypothetical protein [Puia sp.]|jgi:hypothetical protein|uniref:hypothetical protein n=1 Tax=Puia sp. TaxID=2045100 RepID=UPI002F3F5EF7
MDQVAAAQFANFMGRFYQNMATQVGDTLHQRIGTISDDQTAVLMGDQARLISYAQTFYSLSDKIAFDGADDYFKKVQDATAAINEALKHIDKVDKVINISANVIAMAGGLASKNTSMMVTALTALKGEVGL